MDSPDALTANAAARNRACLEAVKPHADSLSRGPVAELLTKPVEEWTDGDVWLALHIAAYHLPVIKEASVAPLEPESTDPTGVPNAIANQYTAWWGAKDAGSISRRRAQEARIHAGLEEAPEFFVPSQRYAKTSNQEVARMEAVKGVLLVRRGGRLPMVADRLQPFVKAQGNGHLQLALRPGLGDAVRLLVTKEERLSVTQEASTVLADFENQMRAKVQEAPEEPTTPPSSSSAAHRSP